MGTFTFTCRVPEEGLEPSHLAIMGFESIASTIPPLRHPTNKHRDLILTESVQVVTILLAKLIN